MLNKQGIDELIERLNTIMQQEEATGFSGAVLVQHHGLTLLSRGYGSIRGSQITANSRFWIASMGKQFTSAAILKCRDEGLLALDDPLPRFIPDVPADKKAITVKQLLSHTSGLSPGNGSENAPDRAAALQAILAKPITDQPGSRFIYSNDNYQLAAAILEIASRSSYEIFVRVKLFDPLNLKDTGQAGKGRDPQVAPTIANLLPAHVLGRRWGQQSYYSTTSDLLRWYQALRSQDVLSQHSVEQIFQPVIPIKEGYSALGWFIGRTAGGVRRIFTRGNEDYGANGLLYAYPETDSVIVVLAHSGNKGPETSYSRAIHAMIEETLLS
jgi:CubicO group peptidase (beta-lactamase class C family)